MIMLSKVMKQIEVVAAIIHDDQDRIFATQRGYGDYKDWWEFPGGKMEAGETPEEALKREIWEELETRIVVERLVETVEWDYPQFRYFIQVSQVPNLPVLTDKVQRND